jgi:hypothetical protein
MVKKERWYFIMKSKIFKTICVCSFCLGLMFLLIDNTRVIESTMSAQLINDASNFQELEDVSDVIIKAKVLNGKQNIITDIDEFGNDLFGFTKTKIEVLESFKGNAKINDTLTIMEGYFSRDLTVGKEIITLSSYKPAKVGKEYVFYLIKYNKSDEKLKGMYYLPNCEKGKYPVIYKKNNNSSTPILQTNSAELNAEILEINDAREAEGLSVEEYKNDYYDKVVEKYLKK